ncbi:MAG TPA: ATP-binding protein [Longimicrobiales bacterium]
MKTTNTSRARILMVDDRMENLVALEAILEPLGHELVRATSGQEALREVLRHDFALILLDVQMPGMNGLETAQIIKARPRSRHIPIIFLTAISKEEDYVFQGYSAGAVDYMFKPLNPDILRSKVEVFVELHEKTEQLRQQGEQLRAIERRELELRHRAELGAQEARYADIVDNASDAIITLSSDGRVTMFNSAAERIFGTTADEIVGRPIDALLAELPVDVHTAGENGRPGEERPTAGEVFGIRADGERFPAEYSLTYTRAGEDRLTTLILRDVSERRRTEQRLRDQALSLAMTSEELRALNDELHTRTIDLEYAMGARSRFYASMSHELRTPINAILGYSSLLLDEIYGPLNEQQIDSLERTNKAATHLLELVNDILDLSKIEAGKMELHLETVPFPDLISEVFVTVGPFADQRATELRMVAPDVPFQITSDARKIRQILLNLLSNAIKFGGGHPVEVVCRRGDGDGLVIEVVDRGPGIGAEDQTRIFEEFVQLKQNSDVQGTGLGLPISRRLAELLGGSLTVASVVGEGSRFALKLPATPPARLVEPDSQTPVSAHERVG